MIIGINIWDLIGGDFLFIQFKQPINLKIGDTAPCMDGLHRATARFSKSAVIEVRHACQAARTVYKKQFWLNLELDSKRGSLGLIWDRQTCFPFANQWLANTKGGGHICLRQPI